MKGILIGTLVSVVLLVFMIAILIQYGVGAFVVLEQSNNMTNSSYSDQWNASIALTGLSFSVLQFSPPLLALACVLISLFFIGAVLMTRGRGSSGGSGRTHF